MRIPRALLAASAFAIATWAVWGSHRADPSGHGTPARPETRAIATGEDSAGEALHGPELIVEYFRRWHEPYPADLDRSTLGRIWNEIAALPTEPGSAGQQVSRPIGDRTQVRRGGGSASWTLLGPFGMETPQSHRFSGRIVDLNVGPSGLRAVAAASGGLWERGPSEWSSLTDGLTTQWTGSLDIHPSNPSTLILGSGEPFIRAGTGFCKSTDGGATWGQKAMSPPPATCFRLRYAANGTTVHGAFDLGYYRSTNGGETWTRTLNLSAWPTDMALHPTNPNVLFLTVWGQGLFRSTNAGLTWSELMGIGLPQTDIGRGAITICDADPNRMYLAYAHTNGNLLGTFRSTDGGATWTDVSPHEYMWGQGWYNNTIAVSPTDPDLVLTGGGELLRSTDGGASWTGLSDPGLHADFHALQWSEDGTRVWAGHDGGVSVSTDAGITWSATDNTLPITQYVLVGASAKADPFVIGGGSQDNGISVTTDGGASWRFRLGGDGGGFAVDPNDSNVMLATLGVYGGIWPFHRHRSTNAGVTWGDVNGGIGLASQWWLRVRNDLGNPVTWYTYGDEYVYRSTNGGFWTGMNGTATAFPHFVAELTASHVAVPNGTVYACLDSDVTNERLRVWDGSAFQERSNGLPTGVRVRKVATHPRKADWAFALMNGMGTPGQKVFRSTDRGITWGNITGNLPDLPLADFVAHPTDDDRLFLGTEMGAFRTTDGGTTWERWQSGLPEAAVITEMTFVDRWDEDGRFTIVMGTYGRGIWVRDVESDPTDVPDDELPGDGSPVGGPDIPRLLASSPNPFRTSTDVSFALPRESRVSLRVFDAGGRQVMLALDEDRRAGVHRVAIDGARLPTGTLFLRLETPDGAATRTITRIR